MRSRATVQSPAGYANQHLQRAGLVTRLQDDGYLYVIHPRESSKGLTDADLTFGLPLGDIRRYGALADSGTTDCTVAVQRAVTCAAGAWPVRVVYDGGFYEITDRVTCPADTSIVLEGGAELRWTATAATGSNFLGAATRPGFEVLGSNFSISGVGKLRGPSSATYVANEIGIFSKGASSANRHQVFVVGPGVKFEKWGYGAVVLQFWDKIDLPHFDAFDCGHAGIMALSCGRGRALGIDIDTIGPGDGGGQAYGFTLTHDSTGYDVDTAVTGGTPRLADNPFCNDWEVSGTIANVPTWQGFDTHGSYELRLHDLAVYNCWSGIKVGRSSGDATNYAGENNSIANVFVTTKKRDGSATDVATFDGYGIALMGGATLIQRNIKLSNFRVEGYGNTTNGASLAAHRCSGHIHNGQIDDWKGIGVYTYESALQISKVVCGAVADATNSICFHEDIGSSAATVDWLDCAHRALGGTVAATGMRKNDGNNRGVVRVDVSEATTPFTGTNFTQGLLTKGDSTIAPVVSVTGTPASVDLAAAGLSTTPRVRVLLNVSGPSTIADITGTFIGQEIELYAATNNATTFDRTNARLAGGVDWVANQYDTLRLRVVNTSSVKFAEVSRAANS